MLIIHLLYTKLLAEIKQKTIYLYIFKISYPQFPFNSGLACRTKHVMRDIHITNLFQHKIIMFGN